MGRTQGKHLFSVWREAVWRLTQLCERAVVLALAERLDGRAVVMAALKQMLS